MATTTAKGRTERHNRPINEVLLAALNDAWRNFEREHGRAPDDDVLDIHARFTTTSVDVVIEEEEF